MRRVFIRRARVIDDVVVDELDVARLEHHLHADFLGDLCQKIECLPLRVRHFRDAVQFLRGLHIGAGIVARKFAVPYTKDGNPVNIL